MAQTPRIAPLPVAGEVHRLAALQGQPSNPVHLIAIGDAAVIVGRLINFMALVDRRNRLGDVCS